MWGRTALNAEEATSVSSLLKGGGVGRLVRLAAIDQSRESRARAQDAVGVADQKRFECVLVAGDEDPQRAHALPDHMV
jgi:hypothetical protein